jgi:hypothetical protein
MQSTLKDTDPHDIFAIESLLHAHAEKAPPVAHDPAAPPAAPAVHITPPISAGAPIPQVEPAFRDPDVRDVQLENARPSEIKIDGLKPPGAQPTSKWVKRVIMALLGLCGATAAAGWLHCLRQPGRPSPSSPARPPLKPPQQTRPPRNRQHRQRQHRFNPNLPRPRQRPLPLRNRPSCNRWRGISPP